LKFSHTHTHTHWKLSPNQDVIQKSFALKPPNTIQQWAGYRSVQISGLCPTYRRPLCTRILGQLYAITSPLSRQPLSAQPAGHFELPSFGIATHRESQILNSGKCSTTNFCRPARVAHQFIASIHGALSNAKLQISQISGRIRHFVDPRALPATTRKMSKKFRHPKPNFS
jgi:hypothetical protein